MWSAVVMLCNVSQFSWQHVVRLHAHRQSWHCCCSHKRAAPSYQSNSMNCLTEGPECFAHFAEESMLSSSSDCRASGKAWPFKELLAFLQLLLSYLRFGCGIACMIWSMAKRSQTAHHSCLQQMQYHCIDRCSPFIDCFELCSPQVFRTQNRVERLLILLI